MTFSDTAREILEPYKLHNKDLQECFNDAVAVTLVVAQLNAVHQAAVRGARLQELDMFDYGYHSLFDHPEGLKMMFNHIQTRKAELQASQSEKGEE